MRSSLPLVLGLAAVPALLSTACGPAPAPVAPPAPTAAPVAAPPPAPVAATSYELTPVPEPIDVIGVARWKSPTTTISTLASCAGVPQGLLDQGVRSGVEAAVKEILRGSADPKAMAALVAMDAPVDAVMTLDAGAKKPVMGAFAVGLTSLERAREAAEAAAGHPLTELSPGAWKIGSVKDLHCVIAASAGSTPARLVCGGREKDLTTLAPYLTRTTPTMKIAGGDLHGELRFGPVDARYGNLLRQTLSQLPMLAQSELAIGDAQFDKAVLDAATGLEEEVVALTGDLDKLVLDFAAGSPTCLKSSTAVVLKGKKSWIAGGVAERLGQAGAPPALFWRLPKDAETATYTRGADPARYQGILRTARTLVDGLLAKRAIGSAADRKALTDLFAFPLKKNTATVHANGHSNAAPAKGGAKGAQGDVDAFLGGSLGWTLYGFDQAPAEILKQVKDVVAVYNRAGFQGPLKKALKEDAKKYLPSIKTVAAPAKLGKDALDVEIKVANIPEPSVKVGGGNVSITSDKDKDKGKAKDKARPSGKTVTVTAHLLVMGDGDTTWVAFGLDRDELVERLLTAKSGTAPTATLSTRGGLQDLKLAQTLSGGFLTVGYFTRAASNGVNRYLAKAQASDADLQQMLSLLATLPHKGETPILLTSTAVAEGAGTRGELTLAIPKDAVEDVSSLVMNVARVAKSKKP